MTDVADAARRVAADIRRGLMSFADDDMYALLPILDAVACGAEGDRVEQWARAMCAAAGHADPDALYAGEPHWRAFAGWAGVAIALADAEATAKSKDEAAAQAMTPWARASASAAAGLCMCHACIRDRGEAPVTLVVCPTCGNKRCPKASDHRLACTGSNATGQPGSVF